jgi:hypothetical protein
MTHIASSIVTRTVKLDYLKTQSTSLLRDTRVKRENSKYGFQVFQFLWNQACLRDEERHFQRQLQHSQKLYYILYAKM